LKVLFGLVGAALMLLFLGSIVFKLQETALTVVVLIGVAAMLYNLWEEVRSES
jgi:hypothetical protein